MKHPIAITSGKSWRCAQLKGPVLNTPLDLHVGNQAAPTAAEALQMEPPYWVHHNTRLTLALSAQVIAFSEGQYLGVVEVRGHHYRGFIPCAAPRGTAEEAMLDAQDDRAYLSGNPGALGNRILSLTEAL